MEKPERENAPAVAGDQTGEQTVAAAPSAPQPEEEVDALRRKLQEAEATAKANYDLFLRERAELENFKKRMQREQAESIRFANEPLLRDLLPIVDNLERAVSHAQSGGNGQPLVEGVSLILRTFQGVLEKYGVSRFTTVGEPFDPTKHEAMAQVENADLAPNTVVDEHLPGYLLHGRLLRPALVTVAKAPSERKNCEE
ncbi:MAG: nucleotide exchange factor GrpE [Candidatus Binatia bacterium]|nr:nucleotide exchange factor GrpE [Candidatus Binatia bacterium]